MVIDSLMGKSLEETSDEDFSFEAGEAAIRAFSEMSGIPVKELLEPEVRVSLLDDPVNGHYDVKVANETSKGSLTDEQRQVVKNHLDDCESCKSFYDHLSSNYEDLIL